MFDINFKTDDGTQYELYILATYFDDPGDEGIEMYIEGTWPKPSSNHQSEIDYSWDDRELKQEAIKIAYLERENK